MAIIVLEVHIITPTGGLVDGYGLFSTLTKHWFPCYYVTRETANGRVDAMKETLKQFAGMKMIDAIESVNFSQSYPFMIG